MGIVKWVVAWTRSIVLLLVIVSKATVKSWSVRMTANVNLIEYVSKVSVSWVHVKLKMNVKKRKSALKGIVFQVSFFLLLLLVVV